MTSKRRPALQPHESLRKHQIIHSKWLFRNELLNFSVVKVIDMPYFYCISYNVQAMSISLTATQRSPHFLRNV